MPDKIKISGLRIATMVGVKPQERDQPQDIWLDLEFSTTFSKAAQSDKLVDTVDYQIVCEKLTHFVKQSRSQLIEALAENIADFLLYTFSFSWMKLTLTKQPFDMPEVNSVSMVIERHL